jgi:hypothetical protein
VVLDVEGVSRLDPDVKWELAMKDLASKPVWCVPTIRRQLLSREQSWRKLAETIRQQVYVG